MVSAAGACFAARRILGRIGWHIALIGQPGAELDTFSNGGHRVLHARGAACNRGYPLRQADAGADERLVTMFARILPTAARSRLASVRLLTLAGIAAALIAPALAPAPAAAFITKPGSMTVGEQAANGSSLFDGNLFLNESGKAFYNPEPEKFDNAAENPVLHESNVYAVYWDPTAHYHNDWKAVIDGFFQQLGEASGATGDVFAVDGQYTDATNVPAYNHTAFRGAYTDTTPYPASKCADPRALEENKVHKIGPLGCLTSQEVAEQLEAFVSAHKLDRGMKTVYYMLTPPGVTVCLDAGGPAGHCSDFEATKEEFETQKFTTASFANSFCSYHADINPGGLASGDANTILYGVIPWIAGGKGDGQLGFEDETQATYCQDGGFNPTSNPIEQHEGTLTEEEETKFEEMSKDEKAEFLAKHLARPHEQEPNQVPCPSPDGFCDTGLADLEITQIGSEQQDIVTNPLLNAWKDPAGNEATDECRNFFAPASGGSTANIETGAGTLFNQQFGPGKYYLNDAFNLAALRLNYPGIPCLTGLRLEPKFTAPNPVDTGVVVGFDGGESDITLNAAIGFSGGKETNNYAKLTWNFGDGTPEVTGYAPGSPPCEMPWSSECAESVFHSYQYAGTYNVKLTVLDVGGNSTSITQPITVVGLARPGSAGSGGSTGAGTGTGNNSNTSTAVPPAQAYAKIAKGSLQSALSKGLPVEYYVSEQVTGHFEVLLNSKLAHQLGITGTPAVGLPAGSQPEIVIGRALLVTLKGGHSATRIKFYPHVAKLLGHVKTLALELRLVVHNAATQNPATTTVMTTVTLSSKTKSRKHGAKA